MVTAQTLPARAARPLVLIVHSYEKNHVCGQPQADGVFQALMDAGLRPAQVAVKQFYMDTKRTYTTADAIRARGREALALVRRLKPRVVVTLDDNAFAHVGLALVDEPGLSVVFSGMNGQPEDYNMRTRFMETRTRPGHNVTGVYEKLYLGRALSILTRTLPHVKKVVGVTDFSPTGNALTRQLTLEYDKDFSVDWEVRRVADFEEYKQFVRRMNRDPSVGAIYPLALTLATDTGRVTAPEIFAWTVANSTKPEVPLNYYFCSLGLFGGASVDFLGMGRRAGEMAAHILEGGKAGDMSIEDAPDYAIVFNLARARMLGLTIPENVLLAADAIYKDVPLLE
jgi:hypothetical protein